MMNLDAIEMVVVVAVFVLAGLVKGIVGVGLPTIAMGLLGTLMAPNRAAAILVIPALLTNVWQMWDGPALTILVRRLWPMLACALLGTLPAAGILTKANVRLTTALLGVALMSYALIGLCGVGFKVPRRTEPVLGPLVGLATGLINGATGIFVVPGVPYLQALGLGKDELVQALAISAFISTVALALGLGLNNGLGSAIAIPAAIALVAAFVGMAVGQALHCGDRPRHRRAGAGQRAPARAERGRAQRRPADAPQIDRRGRQRAPALDAGAARREPRASEVYRCATGDQRPDRGDPACRARGGGRKALSPRLRKTLFSAYRQEGRQVIQTSALHLSALLIAPS
jgi:uncharacterized membrane protein YfcA